MIAEPLEQSANLLLFPKPDWEIGVKHFQKDSCQKKVEELQEKLWREGPFVSRGPVGPKNYVESSFVLNDSVGGYAVYGRKPGAKRRRWRDCPVIVLGVRRVGKRAYIYFTLARGCAPLLPFAPRYRSFDLDQRIYIASYRNFSRCSVGKTSSVSLQIGVLPALDEHIFLTEKEQSYAQDLGEMGLLEAPPEKDESEERCRELGQKIFDEYKRSVGSGVVARDVLRRILEAVVFFCADGEPRKQYLKRLWVGIGDDTWQWGIGDLPKWRQFPSP